MASPAQDPLPPPSIDELIVRYDLAALIAEVRSDFTPEAGSQRLLKQSDITARFRKKSKIVPTSS